MMHQFKRTVCGCTECVACCQRQPGPLAPHDVEAIVTFTGKPAEEILVASPGAQVMMADKTIKRIGSITPRSVGGRCIFLDGENHCSIHAVAPFGCAYFDTHMSMRESLPRSVWLVQAQMSSPEYTKVRSGLPAATSYNPTPYA